MRTYEIICRADAEITERWAVTAKDSEHAEAVLLGDDSEGGSMTFIEQISVDHETNRRIDTIEAVPMDYCVDGHETDHPDSPWAGDGQYPPFMVFHPESQDYAVGTYQTRAAAQEKADRYNMGLEKPVMQNGSDGPPPNLSIWPFGVRQLMVGHYAVTRDDGRGPLGFVLALAVPDDMDTTQAGTQEMFAELRDRGGPQLALTFDTVQAVDDMIERLHRLKGEMLATGCNAGQEHTPDEHGQCDDCRAQVLTPSNGLHIVFDGPPGPQPGRFVEVETPDGRSVDAGEWHEREDGNWELRLGTKAKATHEDRIVIEREEGEDGATDFVLAGLDLGDPCWLELLDTGVTIRIRKDGHGINVAAFNTGSEDEGEIDELFATAEGDIS